MIPINIVIGPASLPEDREPVYAAAVAGLGLLRQAAEDFAVDAAYDLDGYELMTDEQARAAVDALYSAWRGRAEDVVIRPMPGNPDRALVFAGGTDEDFETGTAYSALREADRLGILDMLGIGIV